MSWRSEEIWNGARRALQGGKYEWEDPPKRDKRRKREEARRRVEKEAREGRREKARDEAEEREWFEYKL